MGMKDPFFTSHDRKELERIAGEAERDAEEANELDGSLQCAAVFFDAVACSLLKP